MADDETSKAQWNADGGTVVTSSSAPDDNASAATDSATDSASSAASKTGSATASSPTAESMQGSSDSSQTILVHTDGSIQ
jgi:hypothetical protein